MRISDIAHPHSMTSSARANTAAGMLRPSGLAILRLITDSFRTSTGLVPLRIFARALAGGRSHGTCRLRVGGYRPWPIIGHFVIGMAIGTLLRRHWRLLVGSIVAFLVYQYLVIAYHALVSIL